MKVQQVDIQKLFPPPVPIVLPKAEEVKETVALKLETPSIIKLYESNIDQLIVTNNADYRLDGNADVNIFPRIVVNQKMREQAGLNPTVSPQELYQDYLNDLIDNYVTFLNESDDGYWSDKWFSLSGGRTFKNFPIISMSLDIENHVIERVVEDIFPVDLESFHEDDFDLVFQGGKTLITNWTISGGGGFEDFTITDITPSKALIQLDIEGFEVKSISVGDKSADWNPKIFGEGANFETTTDWGNAFPSFASPIGIVGDLSPSNAQKVQEFLSLPKNKDWKVIKPNPEVLRQFQYYQPQKKLDNVLQAKYSFEHQDIKIVLMITLIPMNIPSRFHQIESRVKGIIFSELEESAKKFLQN